VRPEASQPAGRPSSRRLRVCSPARAPSLAARPDSILGARSAALGLANCWRAAGADSPAAVAAPGPPSRPPAGRACCSLAAPTWAWLARQTRPAGFSLRRSSRRRRDELAKSANSLRWLQLSLGRPRWRRRRQQRRADWRASQPANLASLAGCSWRWLGKCARSSRILCALSPRSPPPLARPARPTGPAARPPTRTGARLAERRAGPSNQFSQLGLRWGKSERAGGGRWPAGRPGAPNCDGPSGGAKARAPLALPAQPAHQRRPQFARARSSAVAAAAAALAPAPAFAARPLAHQSARPPAGSAWPTRPKPIWASSAPLARPLAHNWLGGAGRAGGASERTNEPANWREAANCLRLDSVATCSSPARGPAAPPKLSPHSSSSSSCRRLCARKAPQPQPAL